MHEPIESDLLRTFLVVAETSNFSAAAQRIGRTQSAVSSQIKKLEQTIGETLFERGARGVLLTRQGIQLVPYARRIIDLLNEAAATIRSKPLDGPVRIGIPEEYSQTVLPAALAAFAVRHPAVEVTVSCDYTVRNLAALERDELDLAVVFDWSDETKGEVICIDPTVWVTSMVHRLHDIDPLPIATYRNSTWSRDFALRSLEQIGRNYSDRFHRRYRLGAEECRDCRPCRDHAFPQQYTARLPGADRRRRFPAGRFLQGRAPPKHLPFQRGRSGAC